MKRQHYRHPKFHRPRGKRAKQRTDPLSARIPSRRQIGGYKALARLESWFSAWLGAFMLLNNLSNMQTGIMFQISNTLITHYLNESRTPSFQTIQKIKTALGGRLDLNQLFED
jgi:hypothetical protein